MDGTIWRCFADGGFAVSHSYELLKMIDLCMENLGNIPDKHKDFVEQMAGFRARFGETMFASPKQI